MNTISRFIEQLRRPSGDTSLLDLPMRLILIELLLRPMGFWGIRSLLLILAALGLLIPSILRAPATWLSISLLIGWRLLQDWPLPDNHIYLLGYWSLALFLSLISVRSFEVSAQSSRLLLGLAFLFAVLWKAFLSPDYMDGRFFRTTLLLDDRFTHTTMLFGGLTDQELEENRQYLSPLPGGAELLHPPHLHEPPAFRAYVRVATWGTVLMEATIALAFLLPLKNRSALIRHPLLAIFCVITYALAPVGGFGWLLVAMGMAQCDDRQKVWRMTYLAIFFLILLYSEIPWSRLLIEF